LGFLQALNDDLAHDATIQPVEMTDAELTEALQMVATTDEPSPEKVLAFAQSYRADLVLTGKYSGKKWQNDDSPWTVQVTLSKVIPGGLQTLGQGQASGTLLVTADEWHEKIAKLRNKPYKARNGGAKKQKPTITDITIPFALLSNAVDAAFRASGNKLDSE